MTWVEGANDVFDELGSSLSSGGGSANEGRGGRSSSSGGGSLNEGLVGRTSYSRGGSLKAGLAGAAPVWPEGSFGGGGNMGLPDVREGGREFFDWFRMDEGGGGGTGRFGLGTRAAVTGEAAGSGNDGISGDLTPLLANDGFWAICWAASS